MVDVVTFVNSICIIPLKPQKAQELSLVHLRTMKMFSQLNINKSYYFRLRKVNKQDTNKVK